MSEGKYNSDLKRNFFNDWASSMSDVQLLSADDAIKLIEDNSDQEREEKLLTSLSEGVPPIKAYREYNGMSEEEFAERMDIPLQELRDIEAGQELLGANMLPLVAEIFDVDDPSIFEDLNAYQASFDQTDEDFLWDAADIRAKLDEALDENLTNQARWEAYRTYKHQHLKLVRSLAEYANNNSEIYESLLYAISLGNKESDDEFVERMNAPFVEASCEMKDIAVEYIDDDNGFDREILKYGAENFHRHYGDQNPIANVLDGVSLYASIDTMDLNHVLDKGADFNKCFDAYEADLKDRKARHAQLLKDEPGCDNMPSYAGGFYYPEQIESDLQRFRKWRRSGEATIFLSRIKSLAEHELYDVGDEFLEQDLLNGLRDNSPVLES